MRYALFSCAGLGDALLLQIVAHNLRRHAHEVVTFHPFMSCVQSWFPDLPFRPFPPRYEEFDRFIIVYEKSVWMHQVLDDCLRDRRDATHVLNPIATPHRDYPFWEEGGFDGKVSLAHNLVAFCRRKLGIEDAVMHNGLVLPEGVNPRSCMHDVIVHPTSSRPGKNWPKDKFLRLTAALSQKGYNPVLITSPQERKEWPGAEPLDSLDAVFRRVASGGWMIGNDSGIGHLASCFGIPTVSLFKNSKAAPFWRPAFAPNCALVPHGFLPNWKGMRWKDHYWHWGISVGRVIRAFDYLRNSV